jgi:hypothetical protein
LQLPVVVDAILKLEAFHEAVLCVFETLLWWGTERSGKPVQELLTEKAFGPCIARCLECAMALVQFRTACDDSRIRSAIDGLIGFAQLLSRLNNPREVADEILRRHHQVQSGKIDGGSPKRDWISSENGKLLRPSPRFQRSKRPSAATGATLTHPYRLQQFVYMLRENGLLAPA